MSTGLALFQQAEVAYSRGNILAAFEGYQKCIKKILKDENPTALVPGIPASALPPNMPRELLGMVWQNFMGFFRDPKMNFTETSAPDAWKLMNSFRPGAESTSKGHKRLQRTERGKVMLKGMQVTAALTIGVMAWDKRDRATAAKRYKEGIEVATTHAPFVNLPPGTLGWEAYVHHDLKEAKDNLGILIDNDTINAELVKASTGEAQEPGRREEVELPKPQLRVDKTGELTTEDTVKFATYACAKCGKRDTKLKLINAEQIVIVHAKRQTGGAS
ncbi:hypothetical protein H0H87_012640 [Tephrocybe sp. NHM501043]|nr:hypothetical protein H0H87_012640 [Tephrocybe sp. NHM501043]